MLNLEYKEYQMLVEDLESLASILPETSILQNINNQLLNSIIKMIKYTNLNDNILISKTKGNQDNLILSISEQDNNLRNFYNIISKYNKILSFHIYNSYSDPVPELKAITKLINTNTLTKSKEYHLENSKGIDENFLLSMYENINSDNYISITDNLQKNIKKYKDSLCIRKNSINNSIFEDFLLKTGEEVSSFIPVIFDSELNKSEKIKEIKRIFKLNSNFINNLDILLKGSINFYKNISETDFNSIKTKINKLESSFGIKPALNTGVFIDAEYGKALKYSVEEKYSAEDILKYLSILNNQCVIAKCSDKNIQNILKNIPILCGDYLNYVADAQMIVIGKKSIDEATGLFLSKNIKDDYTMLVHEIEHFKDMYIIHKSKEEIKNIENRTYKKEIEENSYLSEIHTKEILLNILHNKSIFSKDDDSNLTKALKLSFKKQNIYMFDNMEIDTKELIFNNNNYNHLKSKINEMLAKDIYIKLAHNFKYITENKDTSILIEKLNKGENKKILNFIYEGLNKSIVADVYIQNLTDNKNKNIDLKINNLGNELKSIGILGDSHSKRIMLKSMLLVMSDTVTKFAKLNGDEINQNKKSNFITYFTNNMISLKNVIKIRLLLNEYDDLIKPKYYMAYESGNTLLSSVIDDKVSKSIRRMNTINEDEKKDYILSPMEIYARNSQVFNLKTFINTSFINKTNNVVASNIAKKMTQYFSSEIMSNIKSKEDFEYKKVSTYNLLLDEIPEEMHKEWKEINESLSLLLSESYLSKSKITMK